MNRIVTSRIMTPNSRFQGFIRIDDHDLRLRTPMIPNVIYVSQACPVHARSCVPTLIRHTAQGATQTVRIPRGNPANRHPSRHPSRADPSGHALGRAMPPHRVPPRSGGRGAPSLRQQAWGGSPPRRTPHRSPPQRARCEEQPAPRPVAPGPFRASPAFSRAK